MAIGNRDREYIEARLISPCEKASEVYFRLIKTGERDAARELMKAMQEFTDKCRAIRRDLFLKNTTPPPMHTPLRSMHLRPPPEKK